MIIHDGMRRMYVEQESIFYYITVMNENYAQPAMPAGRGSRASSRAATCCRPAAAARCAPRCSARGTILRECLAAAEILENDYGVPADVFSITSFSELRREALECERWNLLHPGESAARAVRARRC